MALSGLINLFDSFNRLDQPVDRPIPLCIEPSILSIDWFNRLFQSLDLVKATYGTWEFIDLTTESKLAQMSNAWNCICIHLYLCMYPSLYPSLYPFCVVALDGRCSGLDLRLDGRWRHEVDDDVSVLFRCLLEIKYVFSISSMWRREWKKIQKQTNGRRSMKRMNRRTQERTNKRTNERTNERMNERTNERTDKQTNERTNEWTDKRTNDQTNERMDGRTNERTNERTNQPVLWKEVTHLTSCVAKWNSFISCICWTEIRTLLQIHKNR